MISFFDIPPQIFPNGAQYYFNVVVIEMALIDDSKVDGENFGLPEDVCDMWYLDELTSIRPTAYHFYRDPALANLEIPEDEKNESENQEEEGSLSGVIDIYSHQVVEVHPTEGVNFYDMLDNFNLGLWRI